MDREQQTRYDHNTWVLSEVLSRQAARYGDRTWIRMVDGGRLWDRYKVVVVRSGGLDEEGLSRYCIEHLPRFAVPRYIEILEALPKTPTSKVQKNQLRQLGVTPGTWDRAA